MAAPLYDSVVDLLLVYWRGEGPEDRYIRNSCRLLAGKVLSRLPTNIATFIPGDADLYKAEIRKSLAELVQCDPGARALAESLSQTKQAATAQQVSVKGDDNLVIVAGRDIKGLNIQVLSESLERLTGEGDMEHINILAVFANPRDTESLRLGAEDRAIRECIKLSKGRDYLHLDVRHAATIHDVRRALLEKDYRIVHFSGHGADEGLVLEDGLGYRRPVPQEALAEFLSDYSPPIECVILNACYTIAQGEMISMGVPYTIAMKTAISDEGAIEFTRGFYDAIGAGKSIEFAYKEGCRTIKLMNLPEGDIPVLLKKRD